MTTPSRDRPGIRSTLLVDALHTQVRDAGDHLVRSTPAYPNYWDGHGLVLDEAPCSADDPPELARAALERWLARLDATPELAHVGQRTIKWESLDPRPLLRVALPAGASYGRDVTLRLHRLAEPTPTPPEIDFRPVAAEGTSAADADWDAIVAFVIEGNLASGAAYVDATYPDFVRWAYARQRATFAASRSAWWTAWDGPLLVGSLGLFEAPDLRRFQEIETRETHRRRGVASTLIRRALEYGDVSARSLETYIVAVASAAPERLYRSLGFEPCSWIHSVRVPRTDEAVAREA
jgi:GNAT superfamily N-acetyltransferase